MQSRTRRYFLEKFKQLKGQPISEEQSRKIAAYKNALRKSNGNYEDAMARNLLAEDLKLRDTTAQGRKAAQRTSLAVKNSAKKYGFKEAYNRHLESVVLKDGRQNDRLGVWGLSFNAGLKEINSYYHPINLISEIEEYLTKRNIRHGRFLEIGAGSGKTASEIEAIFGERLEVTATGLAQIAHWKTSENTKKIKWKIAHGENMRRVAQSGSIDIIHSNLGIQHAHRIELAMQEANRLLKKGGLFIFSVDRTPLTDRMPMPKNFELVKKTSKTVEFDDVDSELFVYVLRKK